MPRPALVAITAFLAACGGEEDPGPPAETWPPSGSFTGTLTGGGPGVLETGEVLVTVQEEPSGSDAVKATGVLIMSDTGGGGSNLVGKLDRQNRLVVDTAIYFLTATLEGDRMLGTYRGPGGRTGALTLRGRGVFSFCGGGGGGVLAFVQSVDRALEGDAANLAGYTGRLTGRREGDTVSLASPDGTVSLTGTIDGRGSVEGDFMSPDRGPWTARFCAE